MTAQAPLDPGFGRIVVGTDGSPASRAALRWAAREAHLRQAPVSVVRAWGAGLATLAPYAPAVGRLSAEHEFRNAAAELDAMVDAAFAAYPEVKVDRRLVHGAAVVALLDAARGADLLVLGGHRAKSPLHHTLGAVTAGCLRRSPCPIVIIADDPIPAMACTSGLSPSTAGTKSLPGRR